MSDLSDFPVACWALALCWKDLPVAVNAAPSSPPLSHRFEDRCRGTGVTCLVDLVNLPPARSVKSLFKPVPRTQDVVSSVWPNLDALHSGIGATEGVAGLLDEIAEREHVLFWMPRQSLPTLADVEKRLARFQVLGANRYLGGLRQVPAMPPEPAEELAHPQIGAMRRHEERLRSDRRYAELQYDRRVFWALSNTENGDVQPGLEFRYHEEDGFVWAFYEGEGVHIGTLVARKDDYGRIRMAYHHLNPADEAREGQCFSYPELLPGGRLRMHEFWQWTSGDRSAGTSQIEECEGIALPPRVS